MIGVCLFVMLIGIYPFEESTQQLTNESILNKELIVDNISQLRDVEKDLLKGLLEKDPKRRLTIH